MNQIMHTQACKICPVHVAQDHERVWREISPRVLERNKSEGVGGKLEGVSEQNRI